jgi:hypothetical protein
MTNERAGVKSAGEAICECEPGETETKTYFVSFLSGEVEEVAGVRGVHLTGRNIVLVRGAEGPAVFPRAKVWSVACERCEPPVLC